MNTKETTVKKASELHKEQWEWLAENTWANEQYAPNAYKWRPVAPAHIRERYSGGAIGFACACAVCNFEKEGKSGHHDNCCEFCPAAYDATDGKRKSCSCVTGKDSPYRMWYNKSTKMRRREAALFCANIPWIEELDVEFELIEDE